jgi:hypothetical protein
MRIRPEIWLYTAVLVLGFVGVALIEAVPPAFLAFNLVYGNF